MELRRHNGTVARGRHILRLLQPSAVAATVRHGCAYYIGIDSGGRTVESVCRRPLPFVYKRVSSVHIQWNTPHLGAHSMKYMAFALVNLRSPRSFSPRSGLSELRRIFYTCVIMTIIATILVFFALSGVTCGMLNAGKVCEIEGIRTAELTAVHDAFVLQKTCADHIGKRVSKKCRVLEDGER